MSSARSAFPSQAKPTIRAYSGNWSIDVPGAVSQSMASFPSIVDAGSRQGGVDGLAQSVEESLGRRLDGSAIDGEHAHVAFFADIAEPPERRRFADARDAVHEANPWARLVEHL